MNKLGSDKATYLSLPPNLQDSDTEALSYAVDRQIKRFFEVAKKLNVWGNLDELDPKYYDLIAMSINVPAYRSEYTNEQKLNLIKNGLSAYYSLGTRLAIEGVLSSLFGDFEYVPWWEYNGDPYHFKVRSDDQRTFDAEEQFVRMLRRVKAARDIMDSIETIRNIDAKSYIAGVLNKTEVQTVTGGIANGNNI
ncbi:MAG: hypothetical protein IJL91_07025 [Bacteroidales bacterium]|nr:hypothetical protein [Bacteroidales bacterium]